MKEEDTIVETTDVGVDGQQTNGRDETAKETAVEKPAKKEAATTTAAKKERKASRAQRQQTMSMTTAGKGTEFQGSKTVEDLVAKHNEMVLTGVDLGLASRTVKTFADVKTGVLACERLHAQIEKARASTSDTKEKTMKKPTKKSKSNARKSVKGKTTAKKTTRKATGGGQKKFDEAARIQWTGKENPFREKSGRWSRTEKVRVASGQTIKSFLSKGGRTGTLRFCVNNGLAKVTSAAA